jgi:hypothetical protein
MTTKPKVNLQENTKGRKLDGSGQSPIFYVVCPSKDSGISIEFPNGLTFSGANAEDVLRKIHEYLEIKKE